jgi:hypothetical protein
MSILIFNLNFDTATSTVRAIDITVDINDYLPEVTA